MTLDVGDRTIFAFRRNVVVAASAGTGKTHRLTALYTLLALGLTSMGERDERTAARPLAPERIVATTFSRAAAREIARRAERALVAVAEGTPHPFAEVIAARVADLGSAISDKELRARARTAMGTFADARIDTLHGVARRVVARNAFALDEPEGARVLEEDEIESLGAAAVDAALGDALAAGGARAAAARAVVSACAGVSFARQKLAVFFDRLDEEGVELGELDLVDHAAAAAELGARVARIARQSASSGFAKSRAPAAAVAKALEVDGGRSWTEPSFAALADLLSVRLPREADRSAADRDLDALRNDLPGKTRAEQADQLAAWLTTAPGLAVRERAVIAVLADARARFAASKRRAGGLGFGDLLRTARDALRDRPDVARLAREEVGALLVDELQDTSRIQRDLVYLLRERDGRAVGEAPSVDGLIGHGLFLVGDRKQSIYGFRGADVAVFARVTAELAGAPAERALALAPARDPRPPIADFVALTESRRSGGKVLAFVNAFSELDFSGDRAVGTAPRAFEIVYGPGEHLAPVAGREAEGEVSVIRDDGTSPDGSDALVANAKGVAREAHVAAAAAALAIGRGRAPRDVAILARRRATIPLVEIALGRLSIPYVVAGRALYDTSEVRDAAALLRLLLDPRDRLAQATVLRGPIVALSDPALALLSARGSGLSVALGRGPRVAPRIALPKDERARLDAFSARFAAERPALLALPPGEALRLAVRLFELERVMAALPRAEARIANLDRLIALGRRRGGTLAGFSRWLDQRIDDDADEPEAAVFSAEDDAVRLTTIHASKGLDFPVVILVDLEAEPRPEPASIGLFREDGSGRAAFVMKHHAPRAGANARVASTPIVVASAALDAAQTEARARETAERQRLTYVAITRARDELVLIGSGNKPRAGTALRTLSSALDQGALEGLVTVATAKDLLAVEPPPKPGVAEVREDRKAPRLPIASSAVTISIATTPLAIFGGCARRFELRSLHGLEEPVEAGEIEIDDDGGAELRFTETAAGDPRVVGRAAHRVLERWPFERFGETADVHEIERRLAREGVTAASADLGRVVTAIARFASGSYARALREGGAEVAREVPFALELVTPAERRLVVRGAIDLVVRWPDGRVDVVDYKLAMPSRSLGRHAFQLRTYALAAAAEGDVGAAAVHLFGDGRPAWLGAGDAAARERAALEGQPAFALALGALADRFAEARHQSVFPPIARAGCDELRCGFVIACHGPAPIAASDGQSAASDAQLDLFHG